METCSGSGQGGRIAPWTDYAGNPIREGDTIKHPVGEFTGRVFFLEDFDSPSDQWRVDYGDGVPYRLALQIGDKGQAVVSNE